MKCIHNEEEMCAPCLAEFKAGAGKVIMQPGWAEPSGTLTYSGTWAHLTELPCEHDWKYDVLFGGDFCAKCRTLKPFISQEKAIADAVAAERERCIRIMESGVCSCPPPGCYDWSCSINMAVKLIRNS